MLMLIGGMMMGSLFGCAQTKYKVDYCGEKSSYQGAKSSYKPGAEVKLYYKNFMSDSEYSFYLDGEYIPLEFDAKGAAIRFVMPEHDVKLECRTRSSMAGGPAVQNHAATIEPPLQSELPESASMACPECGTAITENMKFCPECGIRLEALPK